MDTWKLYAVTHGHLMVCNPLSESKIDEVVGLLPLLEHARVLDIACGKGEFLRRLIDRWNCGGVGVDISPYFVADARRNLQSTNVERRAEIIEADARQYIAPEGRR